MTEADRQRASDALDRGVDWPRVVALAQFHKCLPLLHRHLSSGALPPDRVPSAVRGQIGDASARIARRNLGLSAALVAIVGDLEAHGIPVLPLKGPVVAQDLYGSIGLRRIRDLDMLCRREHVPAALERLAALGYVRSSIPSHPRVDEFLTGHDIEMVDARTGIVVELHFRLLSRFSGPRVDLASIQDRLIRTPFVGAEVAAFGPEDLLVYLCIHGAQHTWHRLEWVVSVAELLRSGRVRDWDRVAEWTAALRAERRVALGLALAHGLLDAPLPSRSSLPTGRTAIGVSARITKRLVRAPMTRPGPGELFWFGLRTDARLTDRVRRCWGTVVVPWEADAAAVALPRSLWPLYYVLRPLRLTTRVALRVMRMMRPAASR